MGAQNLRRVASRGAALASALVMTAGALVGVQLAGAAPAAAVSGILKVTGPVSAVDSQLSKTVQADCPTGTRVIGGGGWVQNVTRADETKVQLVELRPVHPLFGPDSYVVTGQEVGTNVTTNWWVQAYAICASPVPGMHIVTKTSGVTASTAHALCPLGEDPLGGGGSISNPANRVGLQQVTPLSIGRRFTASALPITGQSTVTAYAICAPTPPGYEVAFKDSVGDGSAAVKVAFVSCPPGKRVHGAAASLKVQAPPGTALQVVYPFNALDQVEAVGVETEPIAIDWKPVVAVAICAF